MNNKVLITVVLIIVAFVVGRQTTPEKVRTEVKTITVEKIVEVERRTKTTTVKKPDGTTVTTTTTDTKSKSDTNKSITDKVAESTSSKKSIVNISMMAKIKAAPTMITYGVSVSKEILGPITVGVFGMTDKTFGITLGMNF
jgi:cytoskeletal protein RodZ